jgi:hypothetical protein
MKALLINGQWSKTIMSFKEESADSIKINLNLKNVYYYYLS